MSRSQFDEMLGQMLNVRQNFGKICTNVRSLSRPQLNALAEDIRTLINKDIPNHMKNSGRLSNPKDFAVIEFGKALLKFVEFHAPPEKAHVISMTIVSEGGDG